VVKQEVDPVARPGIPTMTSDDLHQRVADSMPHGAGLPGGRRRQLRPDVVEGLAAVQQATAAAAEESAVSESDEDEAAAPEQAPAPQGGELTEAELQATIRRLQSANYTPVSGIFDDARRAAIEAGLKPISISDILINQDARQSVPITKDLAIVYRSLNGHEAEFIESFIWDRFGGDLGPQLYNLIRSLGAMVLSVTRIAKTSLPEHRNSETGEVDKEKFAEKWRVVLRWPGFILEAVDINRTWFEERCAKLLSVEAVGNG